MHVKDFFIQILYKYIQIQTKTFGKDIYFFE